MSTIETSVIIPTHNRRKILKKCLIALNKQTYPADKLEIIVIDDGSTDGTKNMIKKLDLKPKLTYRYQEQSGPSKARNQAINLAEGEFIVSIDDDIIVCPEFIESHINAQKNNEKVVTKGPVIYTNNLDNPTAEEMKVTDYSRAFFATGNLSIRRKYLLEVGLFNEKFTEYGWEDLEIGKRLKKLGLKSLNVKGARGYHLKHSFSLDSVPALIDRERQRGRMAVLYFNLNSSLSVRMSTLYWLPFFILERVISIANWPEWDFSYKLVKFFHKKGLTFPRNFILGFMKLHAYFEGMRQGPQQ